MTDNLSEYLAHRPNLERYQNYMNSSLGDKLEQILPVVESSQTPLVLSVGSGTGILEKAIADIVPRSKVFAFDLSVPMLEAVDPRKDEDIDIEGGEVVVIQGDAESLPFRDGSLDVVIASSVVHEIASYKNDFEFDKGVEHFFQETARVLKKGGKLVVRDFMQPEDPERELVLIIGNKVEKSEMSPTEFLERFCKEFKGNDLSYISDQIDSLKSASNWGESATIKAKASDLFEILCHYSWSISFDEEVKEKYAYLPVRNYGDFIKRAFEEIGSQAEVTTGNTYLQDGYKDHILGRLDLADLEGNPVDLPHFTGVVIVEKK